METSYYSNFESKINLNELNFQLPVIFKKQYKNSRNRNVYYFNSENRIIEKRGTINIYLKNLPEKSLRYIRDLWHTLVNMRWRWLLFTVSLVNVIAYLTFGGLFLFDAWISGDFTNTPNHNLCIRGVGNFTSFVMLGIETITTTGYGYFYPTEYCYFVWFVMTGSTLMSIFIDGAFISVVYVKITRPSQQNIFGLFSKKAVISMKNSKLCLVFRLNDRTGKHWIDPKVNLFLVHEKVSLENDQIPNYITELNLVPFGTLFIPVEIIHEIDEKSPFWRVSAKDLMRNRFELVATVTGHSVLTGQSSKSQTSYLNTEILWGSWFCPCLRYDFKRNEYCVEKNNFNRTYLLDTPLCSGEHLKKVESEISNRRKYASNGHLWNPEEIM